MSSRISSLAPLLILAACSAKSGQQAPTGEAIPCALAGAKTFTASCTLERGTQDGKAMVVVHHPDGGFRRLVASEGGYVTADGSDQVAIERNGKDTEVTVGDDHYLFPPQPGSGPATDMTASGSAAKP